MTQYRKTAGDTLARIRENRPVVHSITNYVVMNSTANTLLAMGASPIMAHAAEEMEEITAIAGSLVVNIGTLSRSWIQSMTMAARIAKSSGKPIVLDPVGAGATTLRTRTAMDIINTALPTVIRGNPSEIRALSRSGGKTRGVDSIHSVEDAIDAAKEIAVSLETVVAATGETDLITDGRKAVVVNGGHELLKSVTGTGCAASVIIAAFLAEESDPLAAAAGGLAYFALAAEKAAAQASGPGSFWVKVLDALYAITPDELSSEAKIMRL